MVRSLLDEALPALLKLRFNARRAVWSGRKQITHAQLLSAHSICRFCPRVPFT